MHAAHNLQQVCNCPLLSVSGGILWLRLTEELLRVLKACFIVTAWNERVPARPLHWDSEGGSDAASCRRTKARRDQRNGLVWDVNLKTNAWGRFVCMGLTIRAHWQIKWVSFIHKAALFETCTEQTALVIFIIAYLLTWHSKCKK